MVATVLDAEARDILAYRALDDADSRRAIAEMLLAELAAVVLQPPVPALLRGRR